MPSQRREQGAPQATPGSVRGAPAARRRPTATCSTSTPTSPRSSTCACASSRARWRPSSSFEIPIGEHAPGRVAGAAAWAAWGCWCSTASSPSRSRSATGRRPSSTGAGDLLQPRPPAATTCSSTSTSWHVLVPARVAVLDAGVRRARAAVAADRPGPAAARGQARRAISTSSARSRRQPRLEVRLALMLWHLAARWGTRRAGRHPPLAPAHPPPARTARGRRAPVGLPRARAPRRGRARHRPRRRVAPARHARAPPRLASPGADAPRGTGARRRRSARRRERDAARRVHPGPAAQRAASWCTWSG